MLMTGKQHLVGYFDAPPDKAKVIEFVDRLEPRNTIRLLPYDLASAQAVKKIGAEAYEGPGLAVNWIEVEGPLHDTLAAGKPSPDLRRPAAKVRPNLQPARPRGGRVGRSPSAMPGGFSGSSRDGPFAGR